MGQILSIAKGSVVELLRLKKVYDELSRRIDESPGIPCEGATKSFWMQPPSHVEGDSKALPSEADVVIIGSGITGMAIARKLLQKQNSEVEGRRVVILEARDICSGATGRNGGHVWTVLFDEFSLLKAEFGQEAAEKIMRFHIAHLDAYKAIAEEMGIVQECQLRDCESVEVSVTAETWVARKRKFMEWKNDMPEESRDWHCYEGPEAIEKFRLSGHCFGVISGPVGAMWPYRFVSGVARRLLLDYPKQFGLFTQTPCNEIIPPTRSDNAYYIDTPNGRIRTPCIVHATNAHVSHLVPGMRRKIVPFRATMTAQLPGDSLSQTTLDGKRSFTFVGSSLGFEYLTQIPDGDRELMLGGGYSHAPSEGLSEVGNARDDGVDLGVAAYLGGLLPAVFGSKHWGNESQTAVQVGRVKAVWSGIIGLSADGLPWVGQLLPCISRRPMPKPTSDHRGPVGEWICAGYSGEGMISALLCGEALATMLIGEQTQEQICSWFPPEMVLTKSRWRRARVEGLLQRASTS